MADEGVGEVWDGMGVKVGGDEADAERALRVEGCGKRAWWAGEGCKGLAEAAVEIEDFARVGVGPVVQGLDEAEEDISRGGVLGELIAHEVYRAVDFAEVQKHRGIWAAAGDGVEAHRLFGGVEGEAKVAEFPGATDDGEERRGASG